MQPQDRALLRGVRVPVGIAAAVLLLAGGLVAGAHGVLGAAVGVLLVAAFFTAGVVAIGYAGRISPTAMLAVALTTYLVKVTLLGVLLVTLRDVTVFDGTVFGWSILASTLVWIAAEVRGFGRQRILYVDPDANNSR